MKRLFRFAAPLIFILACCRVDAQNAPPTTQSSDFMRKFKEAFASPESKLAEKATYEPAAQSLMRLCQSDSFFFLDEPVFTPAWTPPEILKLDPSWVEITAQGAHVEFGGGFHHFGYELKLDAAAGNAIQNAWTFSLYSEDSPTKLMMSFTSNKADQVERAQFISGAMAEFERRTGESPVQDRTVVERLVFLSKFNEIEMARTSIHDCAAANSNDWLDQLMAYLIDAKKDAAASTRLDAWAKKMDDFSAWLLASYAYDWNGDKDSAEHCVKNALGKPVDDPDWLMTNARYRGATICAQLLTAQRYATCAQLCDALLSYNGDGEYLAPQIFSMRNLARKAASGANAPPMPPALEEGILFDPLKGIDLSRLAAATPASTQPAPISQHANQERLIEYYHRQIAADPTSHRNYTIEIAYLLSLKKNAAAIAECKGAAQAFPTWWRPQMALVEFADADKRDQTESQFRKWVQTNPGFIHWWYLSRYYRDRGRDQDAIAALQAAVKYPLKNLDDDEVMTNAAFAFDAASYAYQQKQFALVLEIARVWSSPQGIERYLDYDLYAFRAAAELALGQFSAAKNDADTVVQAAATHGLWVQHLPELQQAADRQDQSFVYEPGESTNQWALSPAP